jgi:ATP-dependent DNA helicase RecG
VSEFDNILSIIKQGESDTVEFKVCFQKEVIESIVAFANSKGGKIFIGIDNRGNITGVDILNETINEWINQVKNSTSPSIIPDMEIIKTGINNIVIVHIPEFPVKPVAFKNRYYKRVHNSNHLMSLEEIANEHLKTINSSWDYYIDTFHDFNDVSMDKALKFIQRIERNKNKPFDDDLLMTLQNMN